MLVGLISDTHGVFDVAAAAPLKNTRLVLHAGDVGHHGGHAEILKAYAKATGAPLLAVSGNVDDVGVKGASQLLPPHRVLDVSGWKLLLTHIVAPGPTHKVDAPAAALIQQHQPDLVVCGHSHKAAHWHAEGVHYINPGSAGPARFKLKRTVATLWLPARTDSSTALQLQLHHGPSTPNDDKAGNGWVCIHELPQKAPARLKML